MFASLNLRAFLNFTKFLCSASFKRVLQIHYHSIWGQSHQAALQFSAMFGLHHKRWVSPSLSLLVISILSASFISLWSWILVYEAGLLYWKSSFHAVLFITFCSLCSKLEGVEAVSCTKTFFIRYWCWYSHYFIWTPARSFSSCTFKTIIVSLKMVSFVLPQKRVIHRTRSFRQWSVWLCIMTFPKVCFIKTKHFCWVNSIWDRCINGSAYTSWILLSCSYLLCTWDTNFYRLLLFQLFQFFT